MPEFEVGEKVLFHRLESAGAIGFPLTVEAVVKRVSIAHVNCIKYEEPLYTVCWPPMGQAIVRKSQLSRLHPVHPVQPLARDDDGVLRFKANAIVRYLLDAGPFDLNQLAEMPFSQEDREQFAQLIGYSLDGFGELSYVSDEAYERARGERK